MLRPRPGETLHQLLKRLDAAVAIAKAGASVSTRSIRHHRQGGPDRTVTDFRHDVGDLLVVRLGIEHDTLQPEPARDKRQSQRGIHPLHRVPNEFDT
jgi:hypothetical protein